ncbi:MAG: phage tail sheath family protein, partial [Melioribacteraceae bacterium]|nr:phage tail sheath family protein [Melioribacteraceae bacterium]
TLINKIYNDAAYDWTLVSEWGTSSVTQSTTVYTNGAQTTPKGFIENMRDAEATVYTIMDNVNTSVATILAAAKTFVENNESSLSSQFGLFANILKEVGKELTILPPSGAVVGVYAAVDSNRGVWKAPANVSLNSVSRLTETIDNKEQEDLNVDVVAGKSINAIRAFTGKGILIWGARTLAGNDNEWRYVPVRRFFNMVEESVKKSTYWAVFEPNDANTWIKVKSMIENYLTQKWRDGALAGAKPDEAFFVKVGLGTTMTAQDILEGRMNVEIGMAVVRPAEFIILKFSHKLQES